MRLDVLTLQEHGCCRAAIITRLIYEISAGIVAQLTLQQARHLIVASDGAILLVDESVGSTPVLATVASFGDALPLHARVSVGAGIVGSVAASGIGEIVNDVDGDPRRPDDGGDLRSLVCAPLKVGERD